MDQPWKRAYAQKLDIDPKTQHYRNLLAEFHFADENDVPYLRDQLQSLTRQLYTDSSSSSMPTLWYQRAQVLSLLRFPDLALGDAYKAYMLLEKLYPNTSKSSKTQNEIKPKSDLIFLQANHSSDEPTQIFSILRSGNLRQISMLPHTFKATIRATICRILLIANCFNDCLSVLTTYHWPINMKEEITSLFGMARIAREEEVEFHKRKNLDEPDIARALSLGSVFTLPLPWVDPILGRRSSHTRERIATELQVISDFKCTLRSLPPQVIRSDDHDCDGIFANVDLPAGTFLLSQTTTLAAVDTEDQRCAVCRQSMAGKIRDLLFECCRSWICSVECRAQAVEFFHGPTQCYTSNDDFIPLLSVSRNYACRRADITEQSLLARLLQTVVKGYRCHEVSPLQNYHIQTLHARLASTKSVTFSFINDIQRPIHYLQSLGIDIFANRDFDTWIILDIIRRMRINMWDHDDMAKAQADTKGKEALWLGLTPGISMLNHSCEPNVVWKKEPKTSMISLTITRPVKAGEELLISYIPAQNLQDSVLERRELLADWFPHCRCEECRQDLADLAEQQPSSTNEPDRDLSVIAATPRNEHIPLLVENWFGSALPIIDQPPAISEEETKAKGLIHVMFTRDHVPEELEKARGRDSSSSPELPLSQRKPRSMDNVTMAEKSGINLKFRRKTITTHADHSDQNEPRGPESTIVSSPNADSLPNSVHEASPSRAQDFWPRLNRLRQVFSSDEEVRELQATSSHVRKLRLRRDADIILQSLKPSHTDDTTETDPDAQELRARSRPHPMQTGLSQQQQRITTGQEITNRKSAREVIDQWHSLRPPQKTGEWWYITHSDWLELSRSERMRYCHLGRLMETDAGLALDEPDRCDGCREDGMDCIVYCDEVKDAPCLHRDLVPRACAHCMRSKRRCGHVIAATEPISTAESLGSMEDEMKSRRSSDELFVLGQSLQTSAVYNDLYRPSENVSPDAPLTGLDQPVLTDCQRRPTPQSHRPAPVTRHQMSPGPDLFRGSTDSSKRRCLSSRSALENSDRRERHSYSRAPLSDRYPEPSHSDQNFLTDNRSVRQDNEGQSASRISLGDNGVTLSRYKDLDDPTLISRSGLQLSYGEPGQLRPSVPNRESRAGPRRFAQQRAGIATVQSSLTSDSVNSPKARSPRGTTRWARELRQAGRLNEIPLCRYEVDGLACHRKSDRGNSACPFLHREDMIDLTTRF